MATKKYDIDGDSTITIEELEQSKRILEQELQEAKASTQKKISIAAVISMIVFAFVPLIPLVPADRLDFLTGISDMFFLSMASIVAMYFGATAYMTKYK